MTLDELRALATNTRNGFACWPAPYQMSPTLEDCEFLYALVRVTKPMVVLEFGTGRGISARFIGEALKANQAGSLYTFEPVDEFRLEASKLSAGLPVFTDEGNLPIWRADFPTADLVFIDSDPKRRPADIDQWVGGWHPGLVLVHDANRQYDGLKQGVGVFLPGSDGLWLGRAPG